MTHVTCRLTAKNRDQLRNPTFANRAWAAFTPFLYVLRNGDVTNACVISGRGFLGSEAFNRASRMGSSCPVPTATPDATRQSCLCCVWRWGVNWTIAINVFRLQIFSVDDSLELSGIQFTRRSGHDTDKTVSSCPARRCVGEREVYLPCQNTTNTYTS